MVDKFCILYIDDEESNLRIFYKTFRREYKIITAISGLEGLAILKKEKIDLILSDQKMPEMTGVEFLKITAQAYPEINRILITGYTDFDALKEAINEANIFQYIQKPWAENNLRDTIVRALTVYKLQKENKSLNIKLEKTNNDLVSTVEKLKTEIENHKTTENKLVENNKELVIAKKEAEQSNKLKTEFLQNMSHEIRTPLNGIMGFSEFLNIPSLTVEKRKQYVSIILNSSNQLLRIIDDILEISRLETKQIKPIIEKVCLNDLLLELFSIFDIKAKENKTPLYLKKGCNDVASTIFTDISKLNKILSNLLENALKFTSTGFIEFGYTIHAIETRDALSLPISDALFLQLYVKDTGIGINLEKQEIIFERFSQEENGLSRNVGGLGLGLSIAKENAQLIDGKISLESEKDKGSTFYITIPYKPVDSSFVDNYQINENGKPEVNKKRAVLVVEDEEINYLYIETLIEDFESHLDIIHATNGKDAIQLCKNNANIVMVLMDLKMPIMTGFEATKIIKEIYPDLPIIAQTAYTTIEDKKKAAESGCDDFISKPISASMFYDILRVYLKVME